MRENSQQIWDRIALLNLLDRATGEIEGNVKLQKLTFICELEGLNELLVPFHFRFFRYTLGPYSAELANEVKFLEQAGFISSSNRRLMQRGRYLLDYVGDAVQRSREGRRALEIISDVTRRYGRRRGDQLARFVYGLRVPVYDLGGKLERVQDIQPFLDILNPAQQKKTQRVQVFDDQVAQDLTEEFAIRKEDLKRQSPVHKQIVSGALRRVVREYRLPS